MANPLLLKIAVDDKGNPAIINLGKNAQKTQQQVMPLGNVMKAVFASAVVFKGIQLLTQGLRQAVSQAIEFELAVKRIGAIGGVSGDKLAGLSELARQLAVETEHSAVSIANAGLEIKKMGFSAEQTMQALPTIVDLATASMSDLTEAAKNAMTTMRAFGLEAQDMDRVANVMATTVVSTGIDFADFTESMKFVAPIAKTVGMSLEETAAMMGILGNTAIKGSLGGTTLKNMFLNILKPSDNVRAMLKQMDLECKSFSDVLKELKDRGAGTNDFLETFNKRAVAGALHLAGVSDEVNNLQKELEAQNKTVKEIADEIRDTTAIALKQLVNNLNEVVLSIWDAFGDRPKNAIQGFTDLLKELDRWVDTNKEVIRTWGERIFEVSKYIATYLIANIRGIIDNLNILGPIILGVFAAIKIAAIVQFGSAIATAAIQVGILNAVMTAMGGPVGIAIAAIAGLAFVLGQASENAKKLQAELIGLADESLKTQETELNVLMNLYDQLAEHVIDLNGKEVLKDSPVVRDLLVEIETLEEKLGEAGHAFHGDVLTKWNQAKDILDSMNKDSEKLEDTLEGINRSISSFKFSEITNKEGKEKKGEMSAEAQEYYEHLGHIFVLEQNISKIDKEILKTQKELAKVEEEIRDTYVEQQIALFKKAQEIRKNNQEMIRDAVFSSISSGLDITMNLNQMALNDTLDRLAEEEKAVERRYAIETAAAEGNAYAKEQAEYRYQAAKKRFEDKRQRAEQAARQKEKFIAIAKATADATQAIIGVLADSKGGTISRAAMAAAMTSIAFGYVASLTAAYANYRAGSAGLIGGVGNSTSDSNLARVSKGERVLSTDEIKQMGGNERIQQMIDRGTSITNNRPVNVYVDTLIGTRQFVSDTLIPAVEKELSR